MLGSASRKKPASCAGEPPYNDASSSMTLSVDKIQWDALFPPSLAPTGPAEFAGFHTGKNVLVTGAGGSIGAAVVRAVHGLNPRTLVLLDSSERNLYRIHTDLPVLGGPGKHVPILGSVADARCLRDILERFRPEVVYHAAALKHVPLGEMNPFAVVQNNVFGTSTLAMVARRFGAACLIMISTDKSVNPASVMGASKRLAELILLSMGAAGTRMTSIRLGNVLESEGSVVPLFLEQIARGGPVTVTDPKVERYFLTMEETVRRVLSAAASCPADRAIAIPMMGRPVKIADLARHLIAQVSAHAVSVAYTGLRPGDKLREEFVLDGETTVHETKDGLKWVSSPHPPEAELAAGLAELNEAVDELNLAKLLSALTRLIPEYQPSPYLREQVATTAIT